MNGWANGIGRHGAARSIALVAATVLLLDARLARAQEDDRQLTRAEILAAEREAKGRETTAPAPNIVERALKWYDDRDGVLRWHGLHFAAGGFNSGAGFGYGIGITREAIGSALVDPNQPNRIDVSALAARSLRGYRRLAARVDLRNAGGAPIDFAARVQDFDQPQEVFYGIGADSSLEDRTTYRFDGAEAGLDARWRLAPRFTLSGGVGYLDAAIGPGTDSRYPATPDTATLPDYLRGDVTLAFDSRDSASHPRAGGRYAATLSQFDGRGATAADFRRVNVDTQQIVPLGNRYRRLEFRGAAAFTLADDTTEVPIHFLPALGGVRTLRGFRESRFRDQHAVSATAEYQWEAWWALDAAVFVDVGQVFDRMKTFAADRFDYAYGVGFRLHGNDKFLARLDLAYSREGFIPVLGFKYGF
jgi:hypothetical protein